VSGPYRDAQGTQCLKCAALLMPAERGELVCPEGCGTWMSRAQLAPLVGDGLLGSVGKITYWKVAPFEPTRCLVCRAPLADAYAALDGGALALGQCEHHGVWLQRATRGELERAYAEVIARHAARRADPETAIVTLGERVAELEARVAALEALVRELRGRHD
jgi:hypothetical protein